MTPDSPELSIIIPARDEEQTLPACFDHIRKAAALAEIEPEVVVVVNRCTDNTEAVARSFGARIVHHEGKNLSCIRNAGVSASSGTVLMTIDADSCMSEKMIQQVFAKLADPKTIGGGVVIFPERWSLGILLFGFFLLPIFLKDRTSVGLFWCRRDDFDAIGGFDETLVSVEDLDFARRLKRHGKHSGRRYRTIWRASIRTSMRKFDHFGQFHILRHPRLMWRLLRGRDQDAANTYWYDFKR